MQDIFIEDVGSGTPLVLVHGFLGSSDMWSPQIKFFKVIMEEFSNSNCLIISYY